MKVVAILTDLDHVEDHDHSELNSNAILEDNLLKRSLEKIGFEVERVAWDNQNQDWTKFTALIFRTTWNYIDKIDQFKDWMEKVSKQCISINPFELISWNFDKHYLLDLMEKGINIPKSYFIEQGDIKSLKEHFLETNFDDAVIKPAISGSAKYTYRINHSNISSYEEIFREVISSRSMIIQPFINSIVNRGEISLILIDGKYSHAVIKNSKDGDFRVQDDWGGTVQSNYIPTNEEIQFSEKVLSVCNPKPIYARIDIANDNNDNITLIEAEFIEPELWFRFNSSASDNLADSISKFITKNT